MRCTDELLLVTELFLSQVSKLEGGLPSFKYMYLLPGDIVFLGYNCKRLCSASCWEILVKFNCRVRSGPVTVTIHFQCSIAHYKVDILCVYKVGFRSPLYIPTMGGKAVFCARNMPLDLEDDFIATLAFFHFIDRWFPSKNDHNMSHHPLYRNMSPQ